jgi:hypothetical protein
MLNNPKLKFYHTQQVWGTRQDELRVFYKNSPTGNWNLLASYTNSINAWKADSINLPSPSSTYFIAFEGNARYGLGVCIDEVSVTGQSAIKTLNLTVLLEGLYAGGGLMNPARDQTGVYYGDTIADKITIELHNAGNYSNLVYVATDVVLSTNGTATTAIPGSCNGSYYITVKHRNSIETTSANPVSFSSGTISYNFTNAVNKAYGNNLMQTFDGKYVIYGGDVNVDSQVDALDMLIIDNLSTTYAGGYIQQDVNGDGIIDSSDMSIISTNSFIFVEKITP